MSTIPVTSQAGPEAQTDGTGHGGAAAPLIEKELIDSLPRKLRTRHLSMIGLGGVIVVFSFGGLELVTITAGEAHDPGRAISRAVSGTVWRILLFYVGSLAVVVTLLPWNSSAISQSPYVAVLDRIGVPQAGQLMTIVVLVAVLSALNANIYGSSRLLHSLALRGEAPKGLKALNGRKVPYAAILVSVVFGFVSVVLNAVWPNTVFLYLADAIGGVVLAVWAMITCTHLRMRRMLDRENRTRPLRIWGYPHLSWVALAVIAVVIVLLLVRGGTAVSMLCTLVLTVAVIITGLAREAIVNRRNAAPNDAGPRAQVDHVS
jgi:aromatic amino acid permease